MENFLKELHSTNWEDLNPSAIKAAKLVLLDTLGAYIAGINSSDLDNLISVFSEKGSYEILHTAHPASILNSAFVHGTAVVSLEVDEGNQFSKGHPAAHVVPVLLTLLQEEGKTTGKEFILNLVRGYEACSRFGRASTLLPEMHAHGTWGVMGAAATAMLSSGLSSDELYEGVNLSASFSLPTRWQSALDGKLIRNVYVGQAIEAGIRSMKLTKAGYEAPGKNIEFVFTKLLGSGWDNEQLIRHKDELWDIEQNYFKAHAFCRYSHAPLEAFKSIVLEHGITADEIERINVYTYSRAASLSNQHYSNSLSAKFSIPYAISSWMYLKKSDHTAFSERYLLNNHIKSFANKVYVQRDEKLELNYPIIMPAVVEVILTSGKKFEVNLDGAMGGPESKFTQEEILDKFKRLTNDYLDINQIDKIIEFIFNLDQQDNVKDLIRLIRRRGSQ